MTIPAQRVPIHDMLPPAPRRSRRYLLPILLVVLLGGVIAVPSGTTRRPIGTLAAAAGARTATATASPPTPYELAHQALDRQAAALLRGDRAGWLAAVDPRQPALRKRYQDLYASLTALHVTRLEYHSYIESSSGDSITLGAEMAFCFDHTCPPYVTNPHSGPPRTTQQLTLKPVGDRYVITKTAKAQNQTDLQPLPWEAGDLLFVQGKRVTVAAPRALAKRLPEVLAVADKAAQTDDRIARYMDNPQPRYRIFLATDQAWKTWYGGETAGYSVAYTIPLNDAGSDVVLHMSDLTDDAQELKVVVQHELAHVATLSNLPRQQRTGPVADGRRRRICRMVAAAHPVELELSGDPRGPPRQSSASGRWCSPRSRTTPPAGRSTSSTGSATSRSTAWSPSTARPGR